MILITDLFNVSTGTNLDFEDHVPKVKGGVRFVSRQEASNGVVGAIQRMPNIEPLPANTISVSGLHARAFLQEEEWYSGQNMFCLTPKIKFSKKELLMYCMYISANKFRWGYSRYANKTLSKLLLPSSQEIQNG